MNNTIPLTPTNFFPRVLRSFSARMARHDNDVVKVLREYFDPAIRKYEAAKYARYLTSIQGKLPGMQDMAALPPRLYTGSPDYVRRFVLELTNHCNLRCRYCHQNQPDFEATPELSSGTFEDILTYLSCHPIDIIDLTGGGDILMASDWSDKCNKLLELGIKLDTTINLGKILDDAQIDTLSQFNLVTVSIDTLDRKTLSDVRKSVDIRTIVYNMMRIRAAAVKRHYLALRKDSVNSGDKQPSGPEWLISAVYSAEVVHRLPELASYAVSFGAKAFQIQDLMEFNSIVDNVKSVWTLKGQAAIDADTATRLAIDIASHHGLSIQMPPNLLGRLEEFSKRARDAMTNPDPELQPEPVEAAFAPVTVTEAPAAATEGLELKDFLADLAPSACQSIALVPAEPVVVVPVAEAPSVSAAQEELLVQKNVGSKQSTYNTVPQKQAGMTRNCTDPWTFMQILSNTGIRPCCFTGLETGSVEKTRGGIEGALNSDVAVRLRKELLTGNLDEYCSMCSYKSMTDVASFQKKIGQMMDTAEMNAARRRATIADAV